LSRDSGAGLLGGWPDHRGVPSRRGSLRPSGGPNRIAPPERGGANRISRFFGRLHADPASTARRPSQIAVPTNFEEYPFPEVRCMNKLGPYLEDPGFSLINFLTIGGFFGSRRLCTCPGRGSRTPSTRPSCTAASSLGAVGGNPPPCRLLILNIHQHLPCW
jgi:hypothetical protein